MNVAQANLDLLAEQLDSPRVDELQWSLSRMEELNEGHLQLARQGETIGDEAWLSLVSADRDVWSTVDTSDARLEIATDIDIYGDEARVRELLENLFRNAVEHGRRVLRRGHSRTQPSTARRPPSGAKARGAIA